MTVSFEGLPRPGADRLVVYVMGPGFGESQAVAFPDGRWLVVDSCRYRQGCLPLALLRHFGARAIDLLVATHPDLDHIDGLDELIAGVPVERAWRFPKAGQLRTLVARFLAQRPDNHRLVALGRAMDALDGLADANRGWDVAYGHCRFEPAGAPYRVTNLAPTPHDERRAWRAFEQLIERGERDQPTLSPTIVGYLTKLRKNLGDHPNLVSLAASVEWNGFTVLLAGDVESGDGTEHSGWVGIRGLLERDGLLACVTDLAVVKLAHHGSKGAFEPAVWRDHASGSPVSVVVCAPFKRGRVELPDQSTLGWVRQYAGLLAVTADPGHVEPRATAAGWQVTSLETADTAEAPCVAVVLGASGTIEVHGAPSARAYAGA